MSETPQTTPARVDEDELELARRLFDAARHGQTGLLGTFLRRGVSPDLQNTGGDTFLTLAAYHRRPETVAMLLELGADPAEGLLDGVARPPLSREWNEAQAEL